MDETEVNDVACNGEEADAEHSHVDMGLHHHQQGNDNVVTESSTQERPPTQETQGRTLDSTTQEDDDNPTEKQQRSVVTAATSPGAVPASPHEDTTSNHAVKAQRYDAPHSNEGNLEEEQDEELIKQDNNAVETATTEWNNHHNQEEEEEAVVVMVEATPVHEIFATEVIREEIIQAQPYHHHHHHHHPPPTVATDSPSPLSSRPPDHHPTRPNTGRNNLTVEHVDIDGEEEDPINKTSINNDTINSTTDSSMPGIRILPKPSNIVLLILGIMLSFSAMVGIIFVWLMPDREDFPLLVRTEEDNACLYEQELLLFHLEQLRGIAWIELPVAAAVLSIVIYHCFDFLQDKYCLAPDAPPPSSWRTARRDYIINLIIFSLEILWTFVVIILIISIAMQELRVPSQLLKQSCLELKEEEDIANQIGELNHYYTSALTRLSLLIFLLAARGRLVFSPHSCEHIAPFWRRFWVVIKMVMELSLLIMGASRFSICLVPVIEDVKYYEPVV